MFAEPPTATASLVSAVDYRRAEGGVRERNQKLKDQHERFDRFAASSPKIVMAVFFREMEERLLSVIVSEKEKMASQPRTPQSTRGRSR